jgi:hypothetical protein
MRCGMKLGIAVVLFLMVACTGSGSSRPGVSTPAPILGSAPAATGTPDNAVQVPPPGSERIEGGCGSSQIYRGGSLPGWANVNAPFLPYVVAKPGIAIGYLFSFPLAAGPGGNKVLWYVGTPRGGHPLNAQGHPLGASGPAAWFTKLADSGPGEIYPTGPAVPSAGCWHFTLEWQGGLQRAEVDLRFN